MWAGLGDVTYSVIMPYNENPRENLAVVLSTYRDLAPRALAKAVVGAVRQDKAEGVRAVGVGCGMEANS